MIHYKEKVKSDDADDGTGTQEEQIKSTEILVKEPKSDLIQVEDDGEVLHNLESEPNVHVNEHSLIPEFVHRFKKLYASGPTTDVTFTITPKSGTNNLNTLLQTFNPANEAKRILKKDYKLRLS